LPSAIYLSGAPASLPAQLCLAHSPAKMPPLLWLACAPGIRQRARVIVLFITTVVLVAYLLGSIPFGLIIGKAQGLDVRDHGSRNIGATNVWRVLGKKFGLLTFFCDAAKGWLAVVVGFWIYEHWNWLLFEPASTHLIVPWDRGVAGILAAIGCILGHNFPVWLKLKGGKGVATSLGVIIGMMPLAALIVFAIWGIVFKVSRYVSLASLVAAVALPVTVIALMFLWPADFWGGVRGWAFFYFSCAAALLVIRRHRENIKRLVAGTENRFGRKKERTE
jgi:glycerol-3-phosphate acyltransferase PlsY